MYNKFIDKFIAYRSIRKMYGDVSISSNNLNNFFKFQIYSCTLINYILYNLIIHDRRIIQISQNCIKLYDGFCYKLLNR